MKERIILVPAASETELLRSLAKAGVNSMGWHVMNGPQLAKTALMRSGIAVEETFLTGQEEPALIVSFLREIPYFEAASFADAEALSSALWILRSLITEDEENVIRNKLAGGEFPEKNAALLSVYDKYTSLLRSSNKIDTVGLLRKALVAAAPFDADFLMVKEFPLTPLETSLLFLFRKEITQRFLLRNCLGRKKGRYPLRTIPRVTARSTKCFIFSRKSMIRKFRWIHVPSHAPIRASTARFFSIFHGSTGFLPPMAAACRLPIQTWRSY